MKIDLNLKEIKMLINWAEYKNADLPFNTEEDVMMHYLLKLKEKIEQKGEGNGEEESRTEE